MAVFAHISDVHLGAFPRDETLSRCNMEAFHQAMDICIENRVDFILCSGDLFHTTKPDLNLVGEVVEKMKQVKEAGIDIFVLYGSHDFSKLGTSIADILDSTGFLNTIKIQEKGGRVKTIVKEHKASGVKIAGIVGRSKGMEVEYYRKYDRGELERIRGLKIFAFHSSLDELFEGDDIKGIPLAYLPRNMNYYAGGHLHKKMEANIPGYGWIVYPGALFGSSFTDLEETAKEDLDRGFYMVEIEEGRPLKKEFIKLNVPGVVYKNFDCDGKTPDQVEAEMISFAKDEDIQNRIILMRLKGRLHNGKKYHIDFEKVRDTCDKKGALCIKINSNALKSSDAMEDYDVEGMKHLEIDHEKTIQEGFEELSRVSTLGCLSETDTELLSLRMFQALAQRKDESESKKDYIQRVSEATLKVFTERGVF